MTSFRWRLIGVTIVLVVFGVLYGVFGASTQITRSDLSRLTVHSLGLSGFKAKPYLSKAPSLASVPSKVLDKESAKDPASTGAYVKGWKTAHGGEDVDLLIELLPTRSTARQARSALEQEYTIKKDYSAGGLTRVGTISIPQIPGVFASAFSEAPSSKGGATTSLGVAVYQVQHVAVFLQIVGVPSSALSHDLSRVAISEMQVLERDEPGFSMSQSVYPPLRALWFGLGAVGAAVLVILAPRGWRAVQARRERRYLKAQQQQRRHVTGRGSNVLRRRRPSVTRASRPRSRFRSRRSGTRR